MLMFCAKTVALVLVCVSFTEFCYSICFVCVRI